MNTTNQLTAKIMAAMQAQQYTDAIGLATALLEQQPNHIATLQLRAKAYQHTEKFSDSHADLIAALAQEPNNATLHGEMGVLLLHTKQYVEAVACMGRAVALEPTNAYRYACRAYALDAAGKLYEAIDDYKFALALDPEDIVSENNLGMLEEKLGYSESARTRFEKIKDMPMPAAESELVLPEPGPPAAQFSVNYFWQTVRKLATSASERGKLIRFMKRGFRG